MLRNTFETELNGKKIGFKGGTLAIAIACREAGVDTLTELVERMAKQDLYCILSLYYGAACQYLNQRSPELTMSMVSDWVEELGEEKMKQVTTVLLESFVPKNPPAPQAGA